MLNFLIIIGIIDVIAEYLLQITWIHFHNTLCLKHCVDGSSFFYRLINSQHWNGLNVFWVLCEWVYLSECMCFFLQRSKFSSQFLWWLLEYANLDSVTLCIDRVIIKNSFSNWLKYSLADIMCVCVWPVIKHRQRFRFGQ